MSDTTIQWTCDPDPVVRPGLHPGLDDHRAGACHVVPVRDTYRMYYWGGGPAGSVILLAESPVNDPNAWRPHGEILLGPQPENELNCDGPSFPFVYEIEGDRWGMIVGAWGRRRPDGTLPNTTHLALSDDGGLTWRYHDANPIIPLDRPWDRVATGSVCVVKHEGRFRMYYTSITEYFDKPEGVATGHGDVIPRIGTAMMTSADGVHWDKCPEGFVVSPRGFDTDPYEYITSKPYVLREGDGWRMWVSTFGPAYRIRSLTSPDGLAWTWVPSGPEGDPGIGAAGAFDDHQRSYACVVPHGDSYRMWYTGNSFGDTGIGYAVGRFVE